MGYGMVIVERWVAKKTAITILIFLFLSINFFTPVQAVESLRVVPGKLTITMEGDYTKEAVTCFIYATNPWTYGVNASAKIQNPSTSDLSEGYTFIPDLSWITVKKGKIYIPPKATGKFEIVIDIPENQKSLQYNKKWETWVSISNDEPENVSGGGVVFKISLAVKLFIHTPQGNNLVAAQPFYFIIVIVVPIAITCAVIFHSKKRRVTGTNKQ
jgi:hypothetical protein